MARELDIVVTAETAQAEQALGRVDEAVRKVGTTSELTGRAVEEAEKRVDKNIAALEQKWKEQEKAAASAEKAAKNQTAAMGPLEAAVRRYAAPAMIGMAIKQTLAYADSIDQLSKQTGVAPGKLQALEFSAKQFNIALDPLARSISVMSDRLASGDKSAVAAIERLGLSFKNIRGMNPDGAFIEIARAIGEVEDPMQRAADATDLFGRTGIELLPLLTSDIDELMKKARQLGLVMDDETTKAAADLNDQLSNLLDVGKRLLVSFFLPLLPILNPLISGFSFLTAELSKMINVILSPLDQMREFVELLGLMQTRMPQTPKGPGMTFDPGGLPDLGIPDLPANYFRLPRTTGGRGAAGGGNVLPFTRTFNNSLRGVPFDAYDSPALWTNSMPGFPGWYQPPLSGAMEGGLPWAPYAGTVPMNAPGLTPSLWSKLSTGKMGNMLGGLGGMLTGMIPGMSGRGSSIGSMLGGFLGPLGGLGGGLLGGLVGKLFGGGEAGKARNSFIDDFGGMGSLRSAAGSAGVSLDGLMNANKVADVEREVKKLTKAIGEYEDKLNDANAELADMQGELEGVLAKGEDLGFNFDKTGELVSVSFEKMQEKAKLYGIDLGSLGQTFQQQRLSEMAGTLINDFELLRKGGADIGGVLLGMSGEISTLVQDSLKFGTEIPANMQPWIENLINANQLTDENGQLITDLSAMKFGAPIATEFEKITDQLSVLITKIDDMVMRIAGMGQTVDQATRDRTINIGFHVDEPPDLSHVEGQSRGGLVPYPKYLAGGGFIPRGTDTVPAMLTPGEGVMRREAVSRLMRGDWPQGGGSIVIENVSVDGAGSDAEFERRAGKALNDAIKRRRRVNAA